MVTKRLALAGCVTGVVAVGAAGAVTLASAEPSTTADPGSVKCANAAVQRLEKASVRATATKSRRVRAVGRPAALAFAAGDTEGTIRASLTVCGQDGVVVRTETYLVLDVADGGAPIMALDSVTGPSADGSSSTLSLLLPDVSRSAADSSGYRALVTESGAVPVELPGVGPVLVTDNGLAKAFARADSTPGPEAAIDTDVFAPIGMSR